jgi:hypothetical protein
MFISALSCLLLSSFTAAGPVPREQDIDYSVIIRKQIQKRQDIGAINGLPAGLAGLVPGIANMGLLPTIVKSMNSTNSS